MQILNPEKDKERRDSSFFEKEERFVTAEFLLMHCAYVIREICDVRKGNIFWNMCASLPPIRNVRIFTDQ
jgi:hypothetical protein